MSITLLLKMLQLQSKCSSLHLQPASKLDRNNISRKLLENGTRITT
jgi:hypothetical protein